ncbi:MAG: hypothetical protein GYA21_10900 [Myxococcales bacterium]|nr:hypothetical protein [Myxococcales bacterium]
MSRHRHVLISMLFFGWVTGSPARAQEVPRPVVAVFTIENQLSPLSAQDIDSLTEFLSAKLGEGGRFQIVPRDQIRERLRDQQRDSYKQCYDQGCQIEIGRELAAEKVVSSSVRKVGSHCLVTAAIYDLRRAASERTASLRRACNVDDLIGAVEEIARSLCGASSEPTPAAASVPSPVVIQRVEVPVPAPREKSVGLAILFAAIPGGGMYYLEKWGWGIFYTTTVIGGMIMFVAGFGADSSGLTIAGGLTYAGTYVASLIHSGVAAANWRDPDYRPPKSASTAPGAPGATTLAPSPWQLGRAVVFPLWTGRF